MGKYWVYGAIVTVVAAGYVLYRLFKRRDRMNTVALSDWVTEQRQQTDAPPETLPHSLFDTEPEAQDPVDETAPAVLGPAEWRPPG